MAQQKKIVIPKETAKTLAKAKGIRAAARELGIDPHLMLKWSQRDPTGSWAIKKHDRPQNVLTPSQAIENSLSDDSKATRIGFSRAAATVARQAEKSEASAILKRSRAYKDVVDIASKVHGWEKDRQSTGVNLNILSVGGQMIVSATEQES